MRFIVEPGRDGRGDSKLSPPIVTTSKFKDGCYFV